MIFRVLLLIASIAGLADLAAAEDCNCLRYPFEPSPPCYAECTKKLSLNPKIALTDVQGLDAEVAANIEALRRVKNKGLIDFSDITNKQALDRAEAAAAKAESIFEKR